MRQQGIVFPRVMLMWTSLMFITGFGAALGNLAFSEAPLVSIDFNGTAVSSTIDGPSTMAIGDMVKILAWYDNEWGYSVRTVDLAVLMGKSL